MKNTLLIAVFLLLVPTFVFSANTVTMDNHFIQISAIDSDWDAGIEYPINYILFTPGAIDDELVIREGGATGPVIFQVKSLYGSQKIIYMDHRMCHPFIVFSESTFSTGASVTIDAK